MNLFENFDPSTNQILSLNWIAAFLYLFLIPYSYWLIPSRLNMMWMNFIKLIYLEFKLISSNLYQSNIIMFISLMMMLMMMNFLSLMPYIFTMTSHMSFNLIMSLSLWTSFMLYGWIKLTKKSLSHLVPLNTPFLLMNFMVYIELISNIIRPWTLSIRLTANLIAGHLLLTLLGLFMSNLNNNYIMISSIFIQNLLLILEISMALIQAYVYSILSILYFSEIK
uniref:ATP synthase subunit a n=1 Tax=Xylocopa appendiculata TaxID=135683 RepID=A0A343DRE4_9HYME|nr:ATP synthase F0 subunit 6 [Xylocopa appendiculata]